MKQVIAIPSIEINFPTNGKIRSRKVVSRSNAHNTGKYPSWKMQRMMQWESTHEGNAMRILDATPSVVSFNEQPCEIVYTLHGVKRRHYPDLMVVEPHRRELWEVKTARDANEPEVAERTAYLTDVLPAYGYGYRMVLAEVLATQPRLDNVKRLNKLGRHPVSGLEQESIRRIFMQEPVLQWGMFEAQSPIALQHISRLILEGKLHIDLHQPINAASQIRSNFNAHN
ncbi:MAG: TnsA endonuclease N-terminal domain-containing protein [Pseudomonadota bacterium]